MSYEQRAREFAAKWKPRYLPMWHDREKDDLWREFDAGLTALCESIAAEARGQAIEEAAGAVCDGCRFGYPLVMIGQHGPFHRVTDFATAECHAQKVRALSPRPGARLVAREDLAELTECLLELRALVRGECPSLLNEDSGGDAQLDLRITAAIDRLRAGEEG